MAKKEKPRPTRPRAPQAAGREPSEPKPVAAPPGGPYLQMAFFCEKVLSEADGVVSFIRQVDRLITTTTGPATQVPVATYTAFIAIAMKSGSARGSHEIKVVRERPSGMRDAQPLLTLTAFFEGEDRGPGIYGPVTMALEEEGLYWFDVFVDEVLMTRMSFRVIHQRATARAR